MRPRLGTSRGNSVNSSSRCLPRNLKRAKAYAAGIPIARVSRVVPAPTMRLFTSEVVKLSLPMTSR
jgi:hypothetical protein